MEFGRIASVAGEANERLVEDRATSCVSVRERRGTAADLTKCGSVELGVLSAASAKLAELGDQEEDFKVEMEGLYMSNLSVHDRRTMVKELQAGKGLKLTPPRARWRRSARRCVVNPYWQICLGGIIICDAAFLAHIYIVKGIARASNISEWASCVPLKFVGCAGHSLLNVFATLVFAVDVGTRCAAVGWRDFLERYHNRFDMVVAVLGMVLMFLMIGLELFNKFDIAAYASVVFKTLRVLRLTRQVVMCPCVLSLRYCVSKNRRRYIDVSQDFDLDLTYVTPRVIAMGLPCDRFLSGIFRNRLKHVARFFDTRHRDRYLIVNCCPESLYCESAFQTGTVIHFDIQDHAPPTMTQFAEFINIVQPWMARDPRNVLAVHCKAGKGRTGSMIVAWLLYSRQAGELQDALDLYALARTDIAVRGRVQSVETPSQVRYLKQFEELLHAQVAYVDKPIRLPAPPSYLLAALSLRDIWADKPPSTMRAAVHALQAEGGASPVAYWSSDFSGDAEEVALGCKVAGDVRLSVFNASLLDAARMKDTNGCAFSGDIKDETCGKRFIAGMEPGCLFFFLFHTGFLENNGELTIVIGASDDHPGMDKAWKKTKKHGLYRADGAVVLRHCNLRDCRTSSL